MSSTNRSTSDIKDAFSSMNILNYTSVSSDYFPTSSESSSFNSSEDSRDGMIPPTFSLFYNNPYLKDVQAFYAKESPISPQDSITPPAILTPSLNQTYDLVSLSFSVYTPTPPQIFEIGKSSKYGRRLKQAKRHELRWNRTQIIQTSKEKFRAKQVKDYLLTIISDLEQIFKKSKLDTQTVQEDL
ncbi:hypothetical protein Tco_1406880 [Tanacetum coccineum]